ncbi:Bug family tripartite tricarboxylate transporter substrate binding protein [Parapusillimonas granuli]|uniref:Tripartite tricarboxylate transporter substrate binding protein n=1 Tax=Parapusillimonas granuli TaxID=380911 RepID=A0A853G321_9BURK|nr:tripartite tricarboxylate transporter substrate binding protein [Parapusillimonas granuli]MBB5214696.1 tripartite-type tricarboxylate transporter receptor subunit TctC [Parapusillimonas granuli]MEB2398056.1 tripartite tricarboxylate transporter substrate binding protein [Alcaligenaceae bacterium]NYT48896.1 tripartite tricarboxylate transporter substrate binding protein [Parapusillimonas granuli]
MKIIRRLREACLLLSLMAGATASMAPAAHSANLDYPTRPIRLVVPYAPGGTTDVLARLIATELGNKLGKSVIVENKPGASAIIGTKAVAEAAPDGYTLLLGVNTAISSNPLLFKKLPYRVEQLQPVALIAMTPMVISVTTTDPANSIADLVAASKDRKGGLSFATLGKGSSVHLVAELIALRTGMQITPIPYGGSGPALTAIISGQVDLYGDAITTSIPLINAGKIKPIAISSKERSTLYPNLPTFEESGVTGGTIHVWFGVMAPRGTPDHIITTLNKAVNDILDTPAFSERLKADGSIVRQLSPKGFQDFIDGESKVWESVITATNLQLD